MPAATADEGVRSAAAASIQCSARSPWPETSAVPADASASAGVAARSASVNRSSHASAVCLAPRLTAGQVARQTSLPAALEVAGAHRVAHGAVVVAGVAVPVGARGGAARPRAPGPAAAAPRAASRPAAGDGGSARRRGRAGRAGRRSRHSSTSAAAEPPRPRTQSHTDPVSVSSTEVSSISRSRSGASSRSTSSRTYSATRRSVPPKPAGLPRAASASAAGHPSVSSSSRAASSSPTRAPARASSAAASPASIASSRGPSSATRPCARMRATGSSGGAVREARASVTSWGRRSSRAASAACAAGACSACTSSRTSTKRPVPRCGSTLSAATATDARRQAGSLSSRSSVTHANGRSSCSAQSCRSVVLPYPAGATSDHQRRACRLGQRPGQPRAVDRAGAGRPRRAARDQAPPARAATCRRRASRRSRQGPSCRPESRLRDTPGKGACHRMRGVAVTNRARVRGYARRPAARARSSSPSGIGTPGTCPSSRWCTST